MKSKRIFSGLLALVIFFSSMPDIALAETSDQAYGPKEERIIIGDGLDKPGLKENLSGEIDFDQKSKNNDEYKIINDAKEAENNIGEETLTLNEKEVNKDSILEQEDLVKEEKELTSGASQKDDGIEKIRKKATVFTYPTANQDEAPDKEGFSNIDYESKEDKDLSLSEELDSLNNPTDFKLMVKERPTEEYLPEFEDSISIEKSELIEPGKLDSIESSEV